MIIRNIRSASDFWLAFSFGILWWLYPDCMDKTNGNTHTTWHM